MALHACPLSYGDGAGEYMLVVSRTCIGCCEGLDPACQTSNRPSSTSSVPTCWPFCQLRVDQQRRAAECMRLVRQPIRPCLSAMCASLLQHMAIYSRGSRRPATNKPSASVGNSGGWAPWPVNGSISPSLDAGAMRCLLEGLDVCYSWAWRVDRWPSLRTNEWYGRFGCARTV